MPGDLPCFADGCENKAVLRCLHCAGGGAPLCAEHDKVYHPHVHMHERQAIVGFSYMQPLRPTQRYVAGQWRDVELYVPAGPEMHCRCAVPQWVVGDNALQSAKKFILITSHGAMPAGAGAVSLIRRVLPFTGSPVTFGSAFQHKCSAGDHWNQLCVLHALSAAVCIMPCRCVWLKCVLLPGLALPQAGWTSAGHCLSAPPAAPSATRTGVTLLATATTQPHWMPGTAPLWM